uniref:P-type domain-containing protein n=1 Tax=Globodera pallida TaxID=36090 RepID=A0A183CCT4_GLOPA
MLLLFLLLCGSIIFCHAIVDPSQRVDCLPNPHEISKSACLETGCIWDGNYDQYNPSVPMCYYPPTEGYTIQSSVPGNVQLKWTSKTLQNPYSRPNLDVQVQHQKMGDGIYVRIGREDRWLPPLNELRNPTNFQKIISSNSLHFELGNMDGTFSFAIKRNDTNKANIWDTSIGGFVFGDQFIQIATFLASDRLYGLGENMHHELKHDFTRYTTWGAFSRDQQNEYYVPGPYNGYGVHPFYVGLEPSGKAHGVLILNSNAQEYITGPGPHFVYRTVGGQLELFFFPGPTPEEVIRQYQQIIGTPYLPAYWAFGFRLCRWGYRSAEDAKNTVQRVRDAKIPFDVQYADIDYMERYKDFTYDSEKWAGLPEFAEQLHSWDMKLVLIWDPPVQANYSSFQRAIEKGVSFIEWPNESMVQKEINDLYPLTRNTNIMLGPMWPDHHCGFPDFLDPLPNTTDWWVDEFVRFHDKVNFDGIWIDMNEPSVFGTNEQQPWYFDPAAFGKKPPIAPLMCPKPNNNLDYPPYRTWNSYQWDWDKSTKSLNDKTLCMIGKSGRRKLSMYDTHSLYGWSEMIATQKALRASTGKRGSITSRSTFPSSGHYGGHWLGDNHSRWPDLRLSIIGVMEFNMFGIPQIGADVCGFIGDTTEELCLRWQQLGAFHSYYRNHNDVNSHMDQDPAQWKSVATATRVANLFRYQHLPYLYSLHFRASLYGGTVIRPLFFEFPLDTNTHSLSFQFMWGSAMVVVPVISPNVDSVHAYLPVNETWYSMSDAHEYGTRITPGYSTFNAPRNTPLPTFLRGGYIIPRQEPDMTTVASRKKPFQLLAGLKPLSCPCTMVATGELFWDDGETIVDDFAAHPYYHIQFSVKATHSATTIVANRTHSSSKEPLPSLEQIVILGHHFTPKLGTATLNGIPVTLDPALSEFVPEKGALTVQCADLIKLDDLAHDVWTLSWHNEGKHGPDAEEEK